jgi:catechol 2,3-dioxygenase-like lactoylglutathione lyase family enzyme
MTDNNSPILQLRVALTTRDYERLTRFYRQALGIEPAALWNNGEGHAMMLDMGRATLELFDEAQADAIDEIEVGRRVSGQVRFAIQVTDLDAALKRLLAHGAKLVHEPVTTAWGDRNARFEDPDGMQITLFEVPGRRVA